MCWVYILDICIGYMYWVCVLGTYIGQRVYILGIYIGQHVMYRKTHVYWITDNLMYILGNTLYRLLGIIYISPTVLYT